MPRRARGKSLLTVCLLGFVLAATPGCLVRRLKVFRPGVTGNAKLQAASLDQLVAHLRAWDAQIKTMNMTADLEPSLGSVLKGEISELKDVRSFVLIRKPDDIRMIGLYPVVRNRAFDMVSDGEEFKLHIPIKNKFIVGKNRIDKPSPRNLENLRPQHMFEALLVAAPQQDERPVLENDTDELHASYIVHMMREEGGRLLLHRNVWFDRVHLRVERQQFFDAAGDIVSDARYQDYHTFDSVPFPKVVTIMRPKDEYGVKLSVEKLDFNKPLDDDKFALVQPPGSELMNLSASPGVDAGTEDGRGNGARKAPPATKKSPT